MLRPAFQHLLGGNNGFQPFQTWKLPQESGVETEMKTSLKLRQKDANSTNNHDFTRNETRPRINTPNPMLWNEIQ